MRDRRTQLHSFHGALLRQGIKQRIIPSALYQVFPQQAAAFEFADLHAKDHDLRWEISVHTWCSACWWHNISMIFQAPLDHCTCTLTFRVLSVETGSKGARQFIATTYQEFWPRYRRLEAGRHYYEIVREGWPCHLYFGKCGRRTNRRISCTHATRCPPAPAAL